ncbi:methylated-DNA--[protein]-cysteine S-methyltransferase [Patescibacteria group bacterium]|nr:methylated-DNA--[protein]-cysteine S-methyltransferase [Patescibacteria group bacterium]MCL5010145.1 methylated-DNA--[protein]-cysteine S-methyltransferase [Patescibacteria group bacterium]
MNSFERVWAAVSFIPKGKISTYGRIAEIAKVSPRTVGFALNKNYNPKDVPCHRIVDKKGQLAGYAFGGVKAKEKILRREGVIFSDNGLVAINEGSYIFSKPLILYLNLLFEYGYPGPWPWHNINKTAGDAHTPDEIAIGAILTQNTNWRNVEKALFNLKKEKANSITAIYNLGSKNINKLKTLIRPSGFYNQKGERLFTFCKYIVKNYKNLDRFFKSKNTAKLRKELLEIKGIGEETADTMLLYAGNQPTFVIDAYTKRFAKQHKLLDSKDYKKLKEFFEENLPKTIPQKKLSELYQNYHALIVAWGKNRKL